LKGSLVRLAKSLFRTAGLEVRNRRTVYVDPREDLARILAGVAEPVIFDVGANRGDTVAEYRETFPTARIHAFEPTPNLSAKLGERFQSDQRVKVIAQAVSDRKGTTMFHVASNSIMNSMLPLAACNEAVGEYYGVVQQQHIEVPTTTIMAYIAECGIQNVHLLKLDIGCAEKLALAGARPTLEARQIDAVYLEIHFYPIYAGQTNFGDLEAILLPAGYRLYGLYEINRESNGCLDSFNALYVSPQTYARLDKHYLY
jgi:FkbM family methyltransferase